MAASPVAALPVIRTLATVNLYSHFGTYYSTDGAAGAFAAGIEGSWRIATGIHFIGLRDGVLGAKVDANLTSLAKLLVYFDIAFCTHLKAFYNIFNFKSPMGQSQIFEAGVAVGEYREGGGFQTRPL
jgi:hypothetical protein